LAATAQIAVEHGQDSTRRHAEQRPQLHPGDGLQFNDRLLEHFVVELLI
jgi:hypothetical protein